jgi:hypothetical protein
MTTGDRQAAMPITRKEELRLEGCLRVFLFGLDVRLEFL